MVLFKSVEFETVVPLTRVAFLVAFRMSEFNVVSLRRPSAGPWEPLIEGGKLPSDADVVLVFAVELPDKRSRRH